MKLKMIFILMLLLQISTPTLYQNLIFIEGKCKKENIVVIITDIGKANEHTITDINAIDPNLLSGSNTALGFSFENYDKYYIPIDKKIISYEIFDYNIGDTINIDIVFLSQKDRKGINYLSYITSIQKNN